MFENEAGDLLIVGAMTSGRETVAAILVLNDNGASSTLLDYIDDKAAFSDGLSVLGGEREHKLLPGVGMMVVASGTPKRDAAVGVSACHLHPVDIISDVTQLETS